MKPFKLSHKIADYQIYAIHDGAISFDAEKLFSVADEKDATFKPIEAHKISIPVNVFLLIGNGKKIMVDTGAGENFGSMYESQLLKQLALFPIKPEEITDIYLTHVHNDHSGGLTINNNRVFKNAVIHVHENELEYWLNDQNLEQARTDVLSPNKNSFINARKALSLYVEQQQIKAFNAQSNFSKGFSLIEMFGHTPGHSLLQLSDSKNTIIFCADMIHSAELQFENPKLHDGFDIDKKKGIENRLNFYKKIADEKIAIAGTHLPYPGVGKLVKEGNSYIFDVKN